MNFQDELRERVLLRKRIKKEFDESVTLAATRTGTSDEWLLLLDEGLQTWADGTPRFYIMKGVLKYYYEHLSPEFEGMINLGHAEYATFPYPLGKWSKENLELRDAGNGRMALYVRPQFDYDSVFLKELARNKVEFGLSAEFTREIDYEASDRFGFPFFKQINIDAIGVVGDCGAVNAYGVQLKGDTDMTLDMSKLAETGKSISLEQLSDKIDNLLKENASAEASVEEKTEPVVEASEEETAPETTPEPEEKASEEAPAPEPEQEPEQEEGTQEEAAVTDALSAILKKVEDLTQQVQQLASEKEALSAQLKEREALESQFMDKVHKLSASLASTGRSSTQEVAEIATTTVYTDGIGE